jgi:hypothetical protein
LNQGLALWDVKKMKKTVGGTQVAAVITKAHFLQIEYANWSFYDEEDSVTVLPRQTPSFVGFISLKKSQPYLFLFEIPTNTNLSTIKSRVFTHTVSYIQ